MKTILITGSTDGIGKLTATKLAKAGHQVLLHGRSPEKLKSTIEAIQKESNNKNVSGYVADLSNLSNISAMIQQITTKVSKIDVLINNAGVFKSSIALNEDGYDLRLVVNYFAPYLLTNGLLPILKNSESPRLINLSSAAQAAVSLEAISGNEALSSQEAYAQSKLALTMWSFAFAQANPAITTIAVNPGSLLNTKMVQEAYGRHWSSADKGADILYDLALLEKYKHHSGEYFDNDKGDFNEAHPDAYDEEKIAQLLAQTAKIING